MDMEGHASPPTTDVLVGAQAIATGSEHSCALSTAGGVRCWGANQYGQLGDGTLDDRHSPPSVDVLGGVQAISTGGYHTRALMKTGGLRCWGDNSTGALGFPRSDYWPVPVPGLCT
jgi:alpha-tubulin suppressor-like RCC1 family protein